ncbi:MAG TPA: transglycosylase family protein [Solirubrobacterales bacterium]|nr:transglycosylase family protein [Solirubrobacterales bacterium]
MPRALATEAGCRRRLGAFACGALCAAALLPAATAPAEDVDSLQAKVSAARDDAGALASELRATRERLVAVQQEAAAAASREQRMSALLASGEERSAALAEKVARSERRLALERRRLRRARRELGQRLVAMYVSGPAGTASVVLGSADFDDLAVRAGYLRRIEASDQDLARRVEQVRDAVRAGLERVAQLKAQVDAYNERLAAARSEISAVRAAAESAAAEQDAIAAARAASLSTLKSRIGEWVSDIEEAEAASRAAAEETVGRWLGGPFSIPAYIVMCESGGDYGALNPSSGAGGAYQIIPSTWALYGGEGAPHEAPKAEQDRIAAEIWADSGGGAWVCA